jgi:hypothetical protein
MLESRILVITDVLIETNWRKVLHIQYKKKNILYVGILCIAVCTIGCSDLIKF